MLQRFADSSALRLIQRGALPMSRNRSITSSLLHRPLTCRRMYWLLVPRRVTGLLRVLFRLFRQERQHLGFSSKKPPQSGRRQALDGTIVRLLKRPPPLRGSMLEASMGMPFQMRLSNVRSARSRHQWGLLTVWFIHWLHLGGLIPKMGKFIGLVLSPSGSPTARKISIPIRRWLMKS